MRGIPIPIIGQAYVLTYPHLWVVGCCSRYSYEIYINKPTFYLTGAFCIHKPNHFFRSFNHVCLFEYHYVKPSLNYALFLQKFSNLSDGSTVTQDQLNMMLA